MEQVLQFHFDRYPKMQPDDLYKLLHQAAMGSEHAIPNREAASQWMDRELAMLQQSGAASPDEALYEPLSPDGRLVRVNLRPHLQAGGGTDLLLDAFVRTGEEFSGDPLALESYCERAVELARQGSLPFPHKKLEAHFAMLKREGYPVVHHSKSYADAYRPAYRVVLRDLLTEK